ncbi:hypothetical protein BH18ACT15_BH18ACT15_03980 [soil metagenome]
MTTQSNSSRTAPRGFNKDIYRRFELPRKLGAVISGWDNPAMCCKADAEHMRDDDYVIGVLFKGRARAYPLWIVDHYHIINDRVEEDPLLVVSCERCQTGGAFIPEVKGNEDRPPLFRGVGFMNATLIMKDMRTGSYWNHSVGHCLSGRVQGSVLPWVPTFHMEWDDWASLHPDTEVMLPPQDSAHPDARHGHGRDEIFARPGMEPVFVPTIVGELDKTYPESDMALCVRPEDDPSAYPLREVQREGGVVHEERPGSPIAVFAGPAPDGFTMASYVPAAAGRTLSFVRSGGFFVDAETRSRWTIEGRCVHGRMAGEALEPVPWYFMRWHAWIYNHRHTGLFRSNKQLPLFRADTGDVTEAKRFEGVLSPLAERGMDVRVEGPLVSQLRPRDAVASLVVRIDGHRVRLHQFCKMSGAEDFHALGGAWSGFPLKAKLPGGKTRRIGALVMESDPDERFVDPLSIVSLADDLVRWAPVLDEPIEDPGAQVTVPEAPSTPGFSAIVRSIRRSGFEVLELGYLPPGQLRPHCENAISMTVEGDRFLLYRFKAPSFADRFADQMSHSIACGSFVLRSVPDTLYEHQASEILYAGDRSVRWSPLLDSTTLLKTLQDVLLVNA